MERTLYRTIELSNEYSKFTSTQQMVRRLLDENDGIFKHVRDIKVRDCKQGGNILKSDVLERIIERLQHLLSFTCVPLLND